MKLIAVANHQLAIIISDKHRIQIYDFDPGICLASGVAGTILWAVCSLLINPSFKRQCLGGFPDIAFHADLFLHDKTGYGLLECRVLDAVKRPGGGGLETAADFVFTLCSGVEMA